MSFQLRVEFSGLCLYLRDPASGRAAVLMPDGREGTADPVHADGEEGVHHAGYLRFNLANLANLFPFPAGADADDPRFEVVHRFGFHRLELPDLPDAPVDVEDLGFPEFEQFTQDLQLKPGMFSDQPPAELLMRTVLRGGALASSRLKTWRLPDVLKPGSNYQDNFASIATWTVTVPSGTVTVRIAAFDGANPVDLVLRPAPGQDTVTLKVANLCAVNPLEWPELESEELQGDGARDRDFKWLYRLLESTTTPLAARLGAQPDLPVPVLAPQQGAGVQGCMGGTMSVPIPTTT